MAAEVCARTTRLELLTHDTDADALQYCVAK
jgi:hypothetical protein